MASWDLLLDGRKRRGVRMTLIVQPDVGMVVWVHYAPPLSDGLRKAYRQLLRWNDELPFVKFALAEDERPVLTTEVGADGLTRDRLGLAVARSLAICDLLYEPSIDWLEPRDRRGSKQVAQPDPAGGALLDRYAADLEELTGPEATTDPARPDLA